MTIATSPELGTSFPRRPEHVARRGIDISEWPPGAVGARRFQLLDRIRQLSQHANSSRPQLASSESDRRLPDRLRQWPFDAAGQMIVRVITQV